MSKTFWYEFLLSKARDQNPIFSSFFVYWKLDQKLPDPREAGLHEAFHLSILTA